MPEADSPPTARRRRFRLSVRAMLALVAVAGLAMGLGQFWLANRDTDRASISRGLRTLTDREAPVMARRAAPDTVAPARGRQARQALKVLTARLLDDPDPVVRAGAARAIGSVGSRLLDESGVVSADLVRPAAGALVSALADDEVGVRDMAIEVLVRIIWVADSLSVSVVDRDAALPGLLTILGEEHFANESPSRRGSDRKRLVWLVAKQLIDAFTRDDPEMLRECVRLAVEAEDGRVRRGALLSLENPMKEFPMALRSRGLPESERAGGADAFLVRRLRANPPEDRRVILHVLRQVDINSPSQIALDLLAEIADSAGVDDPITREVAAEILIRRRADANSFLPSLSRAALRECADANEFHAARALLIIAPDSDAADEVRSELVSILDRPEAGGPLRGRRMKGGGILGVFGLREPEVAARWLPKLLPIARREADEPALEPIASLVVFRTAPEVPEAEALRSAFQLALFFPSTEYRRLRIWETLSVASEYESELPIAGELP